ncbi:hypothetical protein [Herbidospora mongoliensis]|uniref:hypothetical protein n=1 Tax=Herbidospora mongoliensis TaxID=688067 RepID=UPI000834C5E2|nr:hypothetical protein [Herbidospora mongoliensis]
MGVGKQTTFTVACALMAAAILPGLAGYVAARFEAHDQAVREVLRLRAQLQDIRTARGADMRTLELRDAELRAAQVRYQTAQRQPCKPQLERITLVVPRTPTPVSVRQVHSAAVEAIIRSQIERQAWAGRPAR